MFFCDGVSTIQLTDNDLNERSPVVSEDHVAWGGHDGTDWELFSWDGTDTYQLTFNEFDESADPGISGGRIAWMAWDGHDAEVFLATYVPEPATLSLLVLGGLAVLRRRLVRTKPTAKTEATGEDAWFGGGYVEIASSHDVQL